MNTKLQALAVGVREAAALFAVALVPVVANYYSFRIYEPDKNAVLLALMLLALLAGLVVAGESLHRGSWRAARPLLRQPMVLGAVLVGLATGLSVLAAPLAPLVDRLAGSSERALGLWNVLACLLLFAAVATSARTPEGRARLVAALILGSVPSSLVAILQGLGVYLVQVGTIASTTRVFGTMGNPIFLAAYLMMVLPLTLARLAAAPAGGRRWGLGLVLAAQGAALWLSASRGPQLGLVVGLATLAVAWGLVAGRPRLAWGTVGLGLALALGIALFNLPGTPLAPLRQVPVLGRFGEIGNVDTGSQATRMAIWRATAATLAADPRILVLGHGPESLKYALLNQGHATLGRGDEAGQLVDRGHNVLLDQLVTTGLPGALGLLLVLAGWLLTAARAAGLTPEPADRRLLAACLAAGPLLGALAWLPPATAPYGGATTLLGLAAGLGAYLLWRLLRPARGAPAQPADPLALALLAIGAAVVVESATGLQTVGHNAIFWALAGLTLSLAYPRPAVAIVAPGPVGAARGKAAVRPAPEAVTVSWEPASGVLGLVAAALASSLAFTYFLRGVAVAPESLALVVAITLLTLAAGVALARDVGAAASGFLLTALPAWLLYLGLQWLTLNATADAAVLWPVTLFWYLALALLAGWWLRPPAPEKAEAVRGLMASAYLVAALLVSTAVYLVAVRPVQAAVYFQSATANFRQVLDQPQDGGTAGAAGSLFDRAVQLDPANDAYYILWSEMYTRLGAMLPAPAEAMAAFEKAQALIATAEQLDPNMPYHQVNRGRVQLMAVDRMPVEGQVEVARNAAVPLQAAFDAIHGADPQVANDLALAKLLAQDYDGALALLEYSRSLAPSWKSTLALKGRVLAAAGRLPEAQAALEESLARGNEDPELLIALGEVHRQTGDLSGAVNYYRQVVEKQEITDWRIAYNLGLLYRDLDEFAEAAQALQVAARLAPEDDQPTVQAAMDALVTRSANPGTYVVPGNPAPGQPGSPFQGGTPAAP